ncbi:MAG TPA: hypothetical protein VJX67_08160 [Blastocatellia bacterium]|nr:hypothetical protein [Blastocatellia bacterium]
MATPSRRLVVDASVASAAGRTQHPTSFRSREFLGEVLKISHCAVMTATLAGEWDKHQSLYAARWRADMRSRNKIVDLIALQNDDVRRQVQISKAIEKDLHLIEAALATDKIVISLDDRAQAGLCVDATKEVVWVNAVAEGGHAIYWLRDGAPPKNEWKLGYHA